MVGRLDTESEDSKRALYGTLKRLKSGVYVYTLELDLPLRTITANSYYWYCLQLAAIETGTDADSLHEHFKKTFNMKVEFLDTGLRKVTAASTTTLNKLEFSIYLEKVLHFLREELNIHPAPRTNLQLEEHKRVNSSYNKMF